MNSRSTESAGFTLVELAIALMIIALLAGGLLMPLSAQFDSRGHYETQRLLNDAREALYGYALAQGHLPCPAVPGNESGLEARNAPDKCAANVGLLPWATLGLPPYDAYGNHLRYSVATSYSDAMTPFGFGSHSAIRIRTRDMSGTQRDVTDADAVAAVILAHGRNGVWAYRDGRRVEDLSSTNLDEDINGNGDGNYFFDRPTASDSGTAGGEFDDQLSWIPVSALLSRMVAARRLP